jgi:YcaO-like protein with predicted kinase domain
MSAMGITRVANVTGLDYLGIPVVTVCRPNSRSVAVSQGKGIDLTTAMVSGLMEAIEIFHAEHIAEPLKFASYTELQETDQATADVSGLLRISNAPFDPDMRLFWISGYDLLARKSLWVPLEIVHTNYTLPALPGTGLFFASTNGLASGNDYSEAISHAISEVVERDCLVRWNEADEQSRNSWKVDLSTVEDADCGSIIERYLAVNLAVGVWEITSDIGIPAFCCWLADGENSENVVPGIGSGCHPSRPIALLRALTEAAQMRLTLVSGSRDDLTWEDYRLTLSSERGRSFRARINNASGRKDFGTGPDHSSEYLAEDVDWQIAQLSGAGVTEIIVVDLSKPNQFNIPVVRAIIPGLECEDGFQPRSRTALAMARDQSVLG